MSELETFRITSDVDLISDVTHVQISLINLHDTASFERLFARLKCSATCSDLLCLTYESKIS